MPQWQKCEVALELYVDRGNLDRAPWAMTSLKNSMKWDEERFGLEYDLDIYMIVAVDFFNMGAMENKGLNIFNSKYVIGIGPEKILITALIFSVLLLIPMSYVQTPLQLGILRFLLGAADGALLPAVQTLLVYNSSNQIAGRIFSYNQSFRDIGNVTGPLMGAAISANYGFRAVFLVTAGVVLFNAVYSWNSLRRRRIPQVSN